MTGTGKWPHETKLASSFQLTPEKVLEELRGVHELSNQDCVVIAATLEAESEMRPLAWRRNETPPEQVARGVPEETFDRGIAQLNSWWFRHVSDEEAYDWHASLAVIVHDWRVNGLGNFHGFTRGGWKRYRRMCWAALRSLDRLDRAERAELEKERMREAALAELQNVRVVLES